MENKIILNKKEVVSKNNIKSEPKHIYCRSCKSIIPEGAYLFVEDDCQFEDIILCIGCWARSWNVKNIFKVEGGEIV